jgi:alpha-amylase
MKRCFALFLFLPLAAPAQNIDLMMQAWYWDYFQNGNFGNWANTLNSQVNDLADAGFKHIWLPPLSRSSTPNNFTNGYNPKDLYDFGEYGPAPTDCAWGNRAELDALIASCDAQNMNVVSDMIYNHRDGGRPEKNPAVKTFITNLSNNAVQPSDRFFCVLPLGSSNPGNNGAGDYYIKIKSKTNGYNARQYKFYARTTLTTNYLGQVNESEPNGGANPNCCDTNFPFTCQPSNPYTLGQDVLCTLYDYSGCYTDEFKVTLNTGDFNAVDDTLFIYMNNTYDGCSGLNCYSDHYIYGVYSAPRNTDIVNELEYWTYTDFNGLPSGQGGMNYNAFRPNDNTANSETLGCDWNCPLFFYDYDQDQTMARDGLNAWTKWQLQQGIKGLRMDAVKHFSPGFVGQMLNYLQSQNTIPEYVVGEFFDYNPAVLNNWVNAVYASTTSPINVKVFDFSLRGALKNACDNQGNFCDDSNGADVRNIFSAGVVDGASGSSFNVVTFVDNHDIRHEGNGIQNDAILAYAYILTNNQVGSPSVFYPDYFGVQVGNTPLIDLKDEIKALVNVHQQYIYGSDDRRYLSKSGSGFSQYFVPNGNNGCARKTLIYQLKPNGTTRNVIVAINFSNSPLDVYQTIHTGWGATAGTTFTDVIGNSSTPQTNITGSNEIHVLLPARSYTVFVQGIVPTPVELLDFQAVLEKKDIRLNWKSASESGFDRYEVERSVANTTSFGALGTVMGKSEASGAAYSFLDVKPPVNTPLYYRLKMIDADGSVSYSPVRQAEIVQRVLSAALAPNPGAHSRVLLKTEQSQQVQIRVADLLGRNVWSQDVWLEKGELSLPLPAEGLAKGLYMVTLEGETEHLTLQWAKI